MRGSKGPGGHRPEAPLRIAVFGDTHGHLRLLFELCRRWQVANRVHLDLILQVGDLGYFPDPESLDKATKNFARRDPEELGFASYFRPGDEVRRDARLEETLTGPFDRLETVRAPVLWCHGNHEDFHSLRGVVGDRNLAPVDRFGSLHYVRSGSRLEITGIPGLVRTIRVADEAAAREWRFPSRPVDEGRGVAPSLRLGVIGGKGEDSSMPSDDGGADEPLGWVGHDASRHLAAQGLDVLISHCQAARRSGTEGGRSPRLREVLEGARPRYHFFGHHRGPIAPATVGATRSIWLADVGFVTDSARRFRSKGPVEPGCMAVLQWSGPEDHTLELVEAPWFDTVEIPG